MGTVALASQKRVYNVNVGILGHVDSGKTSLGKFPCFRFHDSPTAELRLKCCDCCAVAALSTTLSTAALDKHPQSKERGITLDLGFSSFAVPMPERLQHLPYDELQVTLVDCPGHASLIKTIIGGAQIIDMMLLVVDVNRGIQTQVNLVFHAVAAAWTTGSSASTCITSLTPSTKNDVYV